MSIEMKPCPKCGSKRVIVDGSGQEYYGECLKCGYRLGNFPSIEMAEIAWNRDELHLSSPEKERIEELEKANKKLLAVAVAAHKIMLSAHYDEMYGWQIGDVSLGVLVVPLSEVYEAGMVGGTS